MRGTTNLAGTVNKLLGQGKKAKFIKVNNGYIGMKGGILPDNTFINIFDNRATKIGKMKLGSYNVNVFNDYDEMDENSLTIGWKNLSTSLGKRADFFNDPLKKNDLEDKRWICLGIDKYTTYEEWKETVENIEEEGNKEKDYNENMYKFFVGQAIVYITDEKSLLLNNEIITVNKDYQNTGISNDISLILMYYFKESGILDKINSISLAYSPSKNQIKAYTQRFTKIGFKLEKPKEIANLTEEELNDRNITDKLHLKLIDNLISKGFFFRKIDIETDEKKERKR